MASDKPISSQVPDYVIRNPNARQFIDVLDGLFGFKLLLIESFARSFNWITLHNRALLDIALAEYGQMFSYPGMPKKVYECLLLNAYGIMGFKGTLSGLDRFIRCAAQTDVYLINKLELLQPIPYIIPSDNQFGFLQLSAAEADSAYNDADLDEYFTDPLVPDYGDFLFLFTDEAFVNNSGALSLAVTTEFYDDAAWKSWFESMLILLLPGQVGSLTLIITYLEP